MARNWHTSKIFSKSMIKKFENFASWTGEKGDYDKYIIDVFKKYKMHLGSMLSWSKSEYRRENPDNLVFFNGNIFPYYNEHVEKIWWGDLDVTESRINLMRISNELGLTLYVYSELEGRFDNEEKFENDLFNAQVIITDKKAILSTEYKKWFNEENLKGKNEIYKNF